MEKICVRRKDCLSIYGGRLLLAAFEADEVGKRKDECIRCTNRHLIGPGNLNYFQLFMSKWLWVEANRVVINDYVMKLRMPI